MDQGHCALLVLEGVDPLRELLVHRVRLVLALVDPVADPKDLLDLGAGEGALHELPQVVQHVLEGPHAVDHEANEGSDVGMELIGELRLTEVEVLSDILGPIGDTLVFRKELKK